MDEAPIVVWFRRDLRVEDNPALLYAASRDAPVIPVYVAGWEQDDPWRPGRAGRWWLERSLRSLARSLASLGAPLLVLPGTAEQALPEIAARVGASEVVWNRLYEPRPREVDGRVAAGLEGQRVAHRSFNAGLLFEPEGHVSRAGRPFVQFTAYWRSCMALPTPQPPLPAPVAMRRYTGTVPTLAQGEVAEVSLEGGDAASGGRFHEESSAWAPGPGAEDLWQPGEPGAAGRLAEFLECCLAGYDGSRDIPGTERTSRLSPHLHFGEIGPRTVWDAVRRRDASAGAQSYLRQLVWREFAHHILYHFPLTPEQPFRPEFSRFPWEDDPVAVEAWKRGETGYPLVDAGMRQLLAEGWMHNRVRMVAASFLAKDLLVPWQEGSAWFWDRLVDADLANNTLGWQWTAGSGPDAAPYFRVFNPGLQARRYDPHEEYVRRWLDRSLHVRPIVDHDEARIRALTAFHGLRGEGSE